MTATKKPKAQCASENVIRCDPKARGRDAADVLIEMPRGERGAYERLTTLAMGAPTIEARRAMRRLRENEEAEAIDGCAHIINAMADAIVAPTTTPADRERLKKAARAILAALEAKS